MLHAKFICLIVSLFKVVLGQPPASLQLLAPVQPALSPTQTSYYVTTDLGAFNATVAANNPLRGFVSWNNARIQTIPSSLEFYSVKVNQVMTGNNTYNWTSLDSTINAAANRGKHVILRFVLDTPAETTGVPTYLINAGLQFNNYTAHGGGRSPYYNDTNLLYALKVFIAALGQKYDTDKRVGFIQAGLLGFWGEWHTYTTKDEGWIPDATKNLVVSWLNASFSNTQIQLRVPWNSAKSLPKFGLHDDSFAYSTLDGAANGGVVKSWFFWPTVKSASYTNFWKTAAMGGEVYPDLQSTIFNSNYPAGTSYHQDYTLCANTTHATYMLNSYAFETGYTGDALTKAKAASNSMGYSFRVTKVLALVGSGATAELTVEVTQLGFAPFYYPLSLVVSCNNGSYQYNRTGLELLLIQAGDAANLTVSVANSYACLNQISISLSSTRILTGQSIKFAQGNNGIVVVSIPTMQPPRTATNPFLPVPKPANKPVLFQPKSAPGSIPVVTPNKASPFAPSPFALQPIVILPVHAGMQAARPKPAPSPKKSPLQPKLAPIKTPVLTPSKPVSMPSQPLRPALSQTQTSYYVTTDLGAFNATVAANNPLRGFVSWNNARIQTIPSSLEFYSVKVNQVMTGNNTYNWTSLDSAINAAANRGKHVILRFVLDTPAETTGVPTYLINAGLQFNNYTAYGGGRSPYYNDTNLLYALKVFIAALGQKYDTDKRVGFIQAGLLGFWGEWHTYTTKDEGWIPDATKNLVVSWLNASFSNTQIQLRVPWSSAKSLPKFGLHDDSFAYSTLDGAANGGAVVSWFFWPTVKSASYTNFWKTAAMGGEVYPDLQSTIFNSNYPAGTSYHQDYILCANTTHTTYMLNSYAFETGYTGDALTKAKAASNSMGYSFRVTKVVAALGSGATAELTVEVTQLGIAPFYYPLSLVVSCNNGSYQYNRTGLELLLIQAGDAANFTVSVANSYACLNQISISLSSTRILTGQSIKFAQGNNGIVVVSIPS